MSFILKIFSAVCFIFIGGALGFLVANRYKRRVAELSCCKLLFVQIKTCLMASQMPTNTLFERLSNMQSLSPLLFIPAVGKRLLTDSDFPKIWLEEIEKAKPALALKKDDYIPLLSLCELFGSFDTGGIIEGVELSLSQVNLLLGEAISENENNGKLSRSIGILGGIAAAIIVI